MRKTLSSVAFAALAVGVGSTAAFAEFQSATACQKAQAWDAAAGRCVSRTSIVTDAKLLKSCKFCKAQNPEPRGRGGLRVRGVKAWGLEVGKH